MAEKIPPEQLQSAPEISPEAQRLEAEEQRDIEEKVDARIATEEVGKVEAGPVSTEPLPAMFRSNRKRPKNNEPTVIPEDDQLLNLFKEKYEAIGEAPIIPDSEDAPTEFLNNDHTSLEWREKLRGLIMVAEKSPIGSERGESLKTYLAERSKELGEKAKEYGPKTVALIGSLSEKYNKLNWKTKIAVTGGLIASVSLTSAAFPIISAILGGALYGQRVIGGIGFAMNRRKALDAKIAANADHWLAGKSERVKNTYATALAAVYMGSTAFAVHEGVEALNELGVNKWLGNMLGHKLEEVPAATTAPIAEAVAPTPAPEVPASVAPEIPQPAAAAAADVEAVASALAPEIHGIEVTATPGKGYEYMMKRLWEQLQEKGISTEQVERFRGSDLGKLLEADEKSVNDVIHNIAKEQGFYKPEGTSVQINLGDKLSFNEEGSIVLGNKDEWIVKAPANAPLTPAYPPETIVRPEIPVPPLAQENIATSEPIKTVDLTEKQAVDETELPTPPSENDSSIVRDGQGQAVLDGSGEPIRTGTFETSPGTNQFGLIVETAKSHIYAGAGEGRTFVFGGTPAERANMILEHLTKNPNSVVFGTDDSEKYRIPWYLVEGKITPGVPMRTSGFFGFGSTWMKPPGPEDLEKVIK